MHAESFGSLLAPEFLCGDNQYSCDFCASKVDATRQLRLRDLPPVLCLSLQRFVFDFNVGGLFLLFWVCVCVLP